MRIIIDMQGAQTASRFRGIGRYTLSFVQAIVQNRGSHEVILVLSGLFPETIEPIRSAFKSLLAPEHIRVWHAPNPVLEGHDGNDVRRQQAEIIREAFIKALSPDIVHLSSLFEGYVDDAVTSIRTFDSSTPVSVSLYDLIPLLNPEQYLNPNKRYAEYYFRKIEHLNKASLCLAISEFSMNEGQTHLRESSALFRNVAAGFDPRFKEVSVNPVDARRIKDKFGIHQPFILYTGGGDERKNLPRLVQAYAALPAELRSSHQLLIAGKMVLEESARLHAVEKSLGLRHGDVCYTGYVTDEELVQIYNLCKLFVFPSWHEGFGLPVLEAMACGAPVIASNTSSLPEVIGLDDALFDPFSVESIATKMADALSDVSLLARLKAHGLSRSQAFSWDISGQRAIRAFEEIGSSASGEKERPVDDDHSMMDQVIHEIALTMRPDTSDEALCNLARALAKIPYEPRQKRLFIDISELVARDAQTGIQRVVRSILNEWLRHPPHDYKIEPVYATATTPYRHARQFTSRFLDIPASDEADELIDYTAGDIFLGLDFQPHTIPAQRHFYKHLRQEGVRVVFVVYDLLSIQMPHHFPNNAKENYTLWLETVAENHGAICISRSVANDLGLWIQNHYDEPSKDFDIDWFHLGADVSNSIPSRGLPPDAVDVIEHIKSSPSFLMVGTLEPRKGHTQALDAFDLLWREDAPYNLVIVGKLGWMVDQIAERIQNHPLLGRHLFWLRGASDEYLEKIYAASSCLLVATEGEGFGLPIIEAAQKGMPIIARDIEILREIAQEHAYYFSGQTAEELAKAVASWAKLNEEGMAPSPTALQVLTWQESAQALYEALTRGACKGTPPESNTTQPRDIYNHESYE